MNQANSKNCNISGAPSNRNGYPDIVIEPIIRRSCPTQKSKPSGEDNKDESESEEHGKDKNEEAEGRKRKHLLSTLRERAIGKN